MQSEEPDPKLHLLERVNIDLTAQNSIVPSAHSIARMKMSGRLPNLHVNFSDSKYKTLMRLIDATMPRLDNGKTQVSPRHADIQLPSFQPALFGTSDVEYMVDDASERGSIFNEDASLNSELVSAALAFQS